MSLLLEDLAEETSASNRRAADRLDAEARALLQLAGAAEELRQRVLDSARQATEYALARLPQAEGAWQLALAALRKTPTGKDAERLLRTFLAVFESGRRLVHAPRALWDIARQLGTAPERLEELNRAEARFQELAAEAQLALEHRAHEWQPSDPSRLALGLQLAREGKTVNAEEARRWFHRTPG